MSADHKTEENWAEVCWNPAQPAMEEHCLKEQEDNSDLKCINTSHLV